MNDTITGIVIWPAGFKIRSKQDAQRFLFELVGKGSHYTFPDVNNHNFVYVISRHKANGEAAVIGHEKKGKNIFEPDFMYSGSEAVELAFKARKSINSRFFSEAA